MVQTGDNPLFQGNRNIRPRHDHWIEAPGLVKELINGGFRNSEFHFLGFSMFLTGMVVGPPIIAISGNIQAHDPLVTHGQFM